MYPQQINISTSGCKPVKRPIGQLLVDGEFVSAHDLEIALEKQKFTNEQLGEILVSMDVLDPVDLKAALSVQGELANLKDALKAAAGIRQLLGELLLQARRITDYQLEFALKEQQRTGEKLGEVLTRSGVLTESELNAVLAFQQNQGKETSTSAKFKLGEILVASNIISRKQLEEALNRQKISKKKIGEILIEAGYARPHHIARGLKIQRKLITAALVAVMSMAAFADFPEISSNEAFASSSAKLKVAANVKARATLKIINRPAELIVTNADMIRGYVDVPTAIRFEVKNNSPAGYLITFDGPGLPFKEVHIKGLGREVQISPGGGWVTQPYARGTFMMELGCRFILTENVQPGTYAWPLSISVSPM